MATVTINIPPADVSDVFAAYTQTWRDDAIRLFFAGDAVAYNNATQAQQGAALLKASIVVTTKNYRTNQAQLAIVPGTEPTIT